MLYFSTQEHWFALAPPTISWINSQSLIDQSTFITCNLRAVGFSLRISQTNQPLYHETRYGKFCWTQIPFQSTIVLLFFTTPFMICFQINGDTRSIIWANTVHRSTFWSYNCLAGLSIMKMVLMVFMSPIYLSCDCLLFNGFDYWSGHMACLHLG